MVDMNPILSEAVTDKSSPRRFPDLNDVTYDVDWPLIPDAFDLYVIDPLTHFSNIMRRTATEDMIGRILCGTDEYDTATETKEIRDKYHLSFDEVERISTLGLDHMELRRKIMENNRFSKNTKQQAVLMVGAGADGVVRHLSCKEYSWRGKGVLSKAEDQGVYPICWVIGATEVLEAVHLIEHKEPVQLSKQQLLDGCASETLAYDFLLDSLFNWIIKHGLVSASKYPWTGKKASLKKMEPEFTLEKYEILPLCDDRIEERLCQRPLCIVIRVSMQLQALQKGKIYHVTKQEYDPYVASCKRLGRPIMYHCVLLTGWKEIDGVSVWEALNSYSDKYCDEGYFYIVRESAIKKDSEYNPLVQVLDVKGFKKAEK